MIPQFETKQRIVRTYPPQVSYRKFEMEQKGWMFKGEEQVGKKVHLTFEKVVTVIDDDGYRHNVEGT